MDEKYLEICKVLEKHAGEEGGHENAIDIAKRLSAERSQIKRICDQWTEHNTVYDQDTMLTNLAERVQMSIGEACEAEPKQEEVKFSYALVEDSPFALVEDSPFDDYTLTKEGHEFARNFFRDVPTTADFVAAQFKQPVRFEYGVAIGPVLGFYEWAQPTTAPPVAHKACSSCDCGAVKAKTTHFSWCSAFKGL